MSIQPAKPVRITASAAIVRDGSILLATFDDTVKGIHYNLPGGGVEPGESLRQAALRETWEETGAHVAIGRLLLIWEYIPAQQNYEYGTRQKVSFCFQAELLAGSVPRYPNLPDGDQIGINWIPLVDLPTVALLPKIAVPLIAALDRSNDKDPPILYGDVM